MNKGEQIKTDKKGKEISSGKSVANTASVKNDHWAITASRYGPDGSLWLLHALENQRGVDAAKGKIV